MYEEVHFSVGGASFLSRGGGNTPWGAFALIGKKGVV